MIRHLYRRSLRSVIRSLDHRSARRRLYQTRFVLKKKKVGFGAAWIADSIHYRQNSGSYVLVYRKTNTNSIEASLFSLRYDDPNNLSDKEHQLIYENLRNALADQGYTETTAKPLGCGASTKIKLEN